MKNLLKKIIKSKFLQSTFAFIGYFYIRLVYLTSSWKFINKDIIDNYIKNDRPFIICFWHGRLLMLPCAWQWHKPFQMLLSSHRDGQLISRVLKFFNIEAAFGSTTREGAKGALSLVKSIKQSATIGITPDGPRGPACKVAPGIITIAQLVEVDIIPVTYATKRRKILNTWDKFLLPSPFNKGIFVAGKPLVIKREDDINEYCLQLELSLNSINNIADYLVNVERHGK